MVVSDPSVVPMVESQLKSTVRPMYSSPPAHGSRIATVILSDPALFQQWKVCPSDHNAAAAAMEVAHVSQAMQA